MTAHASLLSNWFIRAAVATALLVGLPSAAAGQAAAGTSYQRTLAKAQAIRTATDPGPVATIRTVAREFEAIPRRYPTSGYADNALWEGAALWRLAFERSGATRDRDQAVRLLEWLKKEYPSSSLAKQVAAKLVEVKQPPVIAAAAPRPTDAATSAGPKSETPSPSDAARVPGSSTTSTAATATNPAPTATTRPASRPADGVGDALADGPPVPPAVVLPPGVKPANTNTPGTAGNAPAGAATTAGATAASAPTIPSPAAAATAVPSPPAGRSSATRPATVNPSTASAKPAATSTAPAQPSAAVAAASEVPKDAILLRSVTYTALPKGDRLTLELTREASFAVERQTDPDRLFIDLSGVYATPQVTSAGAAIGGSLIQGVQLGPRGTTGLRIAIDLKNRPRYSSFPMYSPYRLVIDIEAESPDAAWARPDQTNAWATGASSPSTPAASPAVQARAAAVSSTNTPAGAARPASPAAAATRAPLTVSQASASSPGSPASPPSAPSSSPTGSVASGSQSSPAATGAVPAPPAATTRGDYSLARQLGLGVARVVIDAGHGGHDPGASGFGQNEADLTLDVALRLEKLLMEQPGVEVVLTRRTDEFLPLEERTAIANRESADLFLSIHANASGIEAARGVETYFLNFATTPQARAVAARENATSAQTMGVLPEIVRAIALNNKVSESRELATTVQRALLRRLGVQNKQIRDLGVKQAPFVVLIGAGMPSVLVEIAFITNRGEATLLKQNAYRQRIAQALCEGVLRYQASLKKVTTVAASAAGR